MTFSKKTLWHNDDLVPFMASEVSLFRSPMSEDASEGTHSRVWRDARRGGLQLSPSAR